jgi:hypothetical protein
MPPDKVCAGYVTGPKVCVEVDGTNVTVELHGLNAAQKEVAVAAGIAFAQSLGWSAEEDGDDLVMTPPSS